jgi:hypothetical protein
MHSRAIQAGDEVLCPHCRKWASANPEAHRAGTDTGASRGIGGWWVRLLVAGANHDRFLPPKIKRTGHSDRIKKSEPGPAQDDGCRDLQLLQRIRGGL